MKDNIIDFLKWVGVIVFWLVIICVPCSILVGGLVTIWQYEHHTVWVKILFSGIITMLVGVLVIAIFNLLDCL